MKRRVWGVLVLGSGLAFGCGGGGQTTSPAAPVAAAPPSPAISSEVPLDASNFDAVALAGGRPCLVEFYSPT